MLSLDGGKLPTSAEVRRKKITSVKTHLACVQLARYFFRQALFWHSGRRGQLRKQSIAKWRRWCLLSHTNPALFVCQKLSFSFPGLFSAAVQGLLLFIFVLTRGDHLLLRTLKHKLADPVAAAIRKGDNRGEEWQWSPPPCSCSVHNVSPSPRGQIPPSSCHVRLSLLNCSG